jgi:hypothetical protein
MNLESKGKSRQCRFYLLSLLLVFCFVLPRLGLCRLPTSVSASKNRKLLGGGFAKNIKEHFEGIRGTLNNVLERRFSFD